VGCKGDLVIVLILHGRETEVLSFSMMILESQAFPIPNIACDDISGRTEVPFPRPSQLAGLRMSDKFTLDFKLENG
jgi:hypothetical protein